MMTHETLTEIAPELKKDSETESNSKLSVLSSFQNLRKPWYHKGLRFQCTECGKCCTGSPGYVWVSEDEVYQMAEKLEMDVELFASRYLRLINGQMALKEQPRTFDCVFLEKGKTCILYDKRPRQCRTFPFWPQHMKSEKTWEELADYCEGVNRGERTYSKEEIEADLREE